MDFFNFFTGPVGSLLGLLTSLLIIYRFVLKKIYIRKKDKKINKTDKFIETLKNKKYVNWKNDLINKIYSDDIRGESIYGIYYPVVSIEADSSKKLINFKGKNNIPQLIFEADKSVLTIREDIGYYKIDGNVYKDYKDKIGTNLIKGRYCSKKHVNLLDLSKIKKEYVEILGINSENGPIDSETGKSLAKLHYPNTIGYAFLEMQVDNQDKMLGYTAQTCSYIENVTSSFILEYEMYKLYESSKYNDIDNKDETLKKLPIRESIHQACEAHGGVVKSGKGRFSECSTQALVLYADSNNELCTVIFNRSNDVSYSPGTKQFIPCGYFEMFDSVDGESDDIDTTQSNFDSSISTFKEFLEEIYGKEETQGIANASGIDYLKNHDILKSIWSDLNAENYLFLGSSFDLVTLTHSLSYLIYLPRDVHEYAHLKANKDINEGKPKPQFIKNYLDSATLKEKNLMPESAGLLKLALKNSSFTKILQKHNIEYKAG